MCLELTGWSAARSFVEAASPAHPSLLDQTHQMDALFGVVNIPNVVWIDEQGIIVRPAEPGWPPRIDVPEWLKALDGSDDENAPTGLEALRGGQDRQTYPDAIRDWAAHGAQSRFALSGSEVVARSQPRPLEVSRAAAEFELANHLWRQGRREAAIAHFNACHRLQPDNWTYKRQAWSLIGREAVEGDFGLFMQGPNPDSEEPWPFESDFFTDVGQLNPGEYFPNTM